MAQRFIACDREQSLLMPPDVREWLPEDHFAWFVLEAVAAMELEAFSVAYRADGRSRPAFDPAMMVALILLRVRARQSVFASDRAGVHRGHRLASDRRAAQARSRDHRPLRRAPQDALAGVFGEVLGLC